MGTPIEVLQGMLEKRGVHTVKLNYYPGAHWDCELSSLAGKHVQSDQHRYIGKAIHEAMARLDGREGEEPVKAVCCPKCGATEIFVQLPAVFMWDGKSYAVGPEDLRSCEFPVEESGTALCDKCEWSGPVSALRRL